MSSIIIPEDGPPNEPSLRTLGSGPNQALAGNTEFSLPTNSGNDGKFIKTVNGAMVWVNIDGSDINDLSISPIKINPASMADGQVLGRVNNAVQGIDIAEFGGAAGGSLAGTYPDPTIAAGAIGLNEINSSIVDPLPGIAGLRTLGNASNQAAPGNDSRFSDSRSPTGAAGGSLGGTYPNPVLAGGVVSSNEVSASIKDPAANIAGLRTLGTGATQATAGNDSRLSDQRTPPDNSVSTAKLQDSPVTLAESQVTNLVSDLADKVSKSTNTTQTITSGVVVTGTLQAGSTIDANSHKIINLANGSNPTDAINLSQLSAVATGIQFKSPVQAVTVTTLPAYGRVANVITETGSGALPSIDGVSLSVSDRLLLKNGAAGADNGIYTVTSLGSGGSSFVLTRATDADTDPEVVSGISVFVLQGTALANTVWTLNTANPITLNTTSLTFVQTGGSASAVISVAGKTGAVTLVESDIGSLTTDLAGKASTAHHTTHEPGGSDPMAVDAIAATGSLRTLGTSATQATAGNDARLSDQRTPLDGSVTAAKLVTGAVTSAAILDGTITDTDVATANKDGIAGTASMRTLGTGAQQGAAGNDARLSDQRTPLDASVTDAKVSGSAAIAVSKLASGSNGNFIRTSGGAAVWTNIAVSDIDATSATDGQIIKRVAGVSSWASDGSTSPGADYTIFWDGSQWNARNNATTTTDYSGADWADVINQASARMTAYGLIWTHTLLGVTCHYAFPTAPTLSLQAGAGVTDGDHIYCICAVSTPTGSSQSPPSHTRRVITGGGNNQVSVSLPVGPAGTTQRKVYRTLALTATVSGTQTTPNDGSSFTLTTSTVSGYPASGCVTIGAYSLRYSAWSGTSMTVIANSYQLNVSLTGGTTIIPIRDPEFTELYLVATINDNTTTSYLDTLSDAAIGPAGTNVQLSAAIPTFSDGGSIQLTRAPSLTTNNVLGAMPQNQTVQLYSGQTLNGFGKSTRVEAQAAMRTQIGTFHSSTLTDTTTTTFQVTETTTPPTLPFVLLVPSPNETMLVTTRTLVSGNIYQYTVVRGYAGRAIIHTTGQADHSAVYATEQGQGRVGAGIDAYNADRIEISKVAYDGNNVTAFGILQKRTKAGQAGGSKAESFITFNDFVGTIGHEFMNGKPFDSGGTSNCWTILNRFDGSNGPAVGLYMSDTQFKINNCLNGTPALVIYGANCQVTNNHFAALVGFNVVELWGACSSLHFADNWVDNVQAGSHGIYRPASQPTAAGHTIHDNTWNDSNQVAGDSTIRYDTATAFVSVKDNRFGYSVGGVYIAYLASSQANLEGNKSASQAILWDPAGSIPNAVGFNELGTVEITPSSFLTGTHAARPVATAVMPGTRYYETDTLTLFYSGGLTWSTTPWYWSTGAYQ